MDSSPTYRPDIDGLRAVAVASVMIYHLNGAWLPGGFVGVDIFFVISGFVVTASLAASRAGSIGAFIAEFYARRLARILPALVVTLVVSAVAATAFIPNAWLSDLSEDTARYAFFGLANYILQKNTDEYFAPRAEFNPYTHAWTLGVEEQFYLLAPLLVFFWIRAVRAGRADNARLVLSGLVVLGTLSLLAMIRASTTDPPAAFYFIGCRLWELMFGVTLFLATSRRATGPSRTPILCNVLGLIGAACIGLSFLFVDAERFPWPWVLLPVSGAALVIQAGSNAPRGWLPSALATSALVWIGRRSYSLYLWHWPIFVLMRWTVGLGTALTVAAALGMSFLLASMSFRWVEQPLRHDRRIEARPRWQRIAGFLALPVVGFLVVSFVFDHPERFSLSTVTRHSLDWYARGLMPYEDAGERVCRVATRIDGFAGGDRTLYTPTDCREPLPPRTIFAVGDSHAAMVSSLFEQISAEQGFTVVLYEFPGCAYIDFMAPMDDERPADCQAFTVSVTDEILAAAKPGDIVFLAGLLLERYGDQWGSNDVPDMYALMYGQETDEVRQAAYEDARQRLRRFDDAGLQVVFMAPTPIFKAPAFRCSDWFNRTNPVCAGGIEQSRAELDRLRAPILDSMRRLGEEMPAVHVWDPFPVLCPGEVCSTERDGRPLFFDGDHLSAYGDLVILPDFRRMVAELG